MSTNAERQKRHRLHKGGNHSLCLHGDGDVSPGQRRRVTAVTGPVTGVTPRVDVPAGLGAAGAALWLQMLPHRRPAGHLALVMQACRMVDRLDQLDRFLRGEHPTWLTLQLDDNGDIQVVVDKALAEERQQAATLTRILAELRAAAGAAPAKPAEGGDAGGILDQLAARRAARVASTAPS